MMMIFVCTHITKFYDQKFAKKLKHKRPSKYIFYSWNNISYLRSKTSNLSYWDFQFPILSWGKIRQLNFDWNYLAGHLCCWIFFGIHHQNSFRKMGLIFWCRINNFCDHRMRMQNKLNVFEIFSCSPKAN